MTDKFVHVVLDRTFVDSSGVRWIVDFKLSRHEGAMTQEHFSTASGSAIATQMETYARS